MRNSITAATPSTTCFLCHRQLCSESYTHLKIDQAEFDSLLRVNMRYTRKVELVRSGFKKLFRIQREIAGRDFQEAEKRVNKVLQVVHYWHILEKLDGIDEIIMILEGRPLRNVSKMDGFVRGLRERKEEGGEKKEFTHFQMVYKFIRESEEVLRAAPNSLPQNYLQIGLKQTLRNADKLDRTSCLAAAAAPLQNLISFPKQHQSDDSLIYIQGIPMSALRDSLDLSMLRLSDHCLLSYTTQLLSMKHLRSFQLRNNTLSCFGMRILSNCLVNLTSLDIRNSNLSAQAINLAIARMPKLQYLYLSDNQADDSTAEVITRLTKLMVLYVDGNCLTVVGAEVLVSETRVLRVLSLQNNGIQVGEGWKLRNRFCRRGGHLEI